MTVYNGVDAFYQALENQVKQALREEAKEIQKAMKEYIDKEIYGSYHPKVYQRTNEFMNSVKIEPVKKQGGEWCIQIYISNARHRKTPDWRPPNSTYSEIADFFANGEGFGRDGKELDVVKETQDKEVEKALKGLLDFLRQKFDVLN